MPKNLLHFCKLRQNKPSRLPAARKAQASVELLMLFAALFAFLLLFMPVISSARQRTDFLVAKQAQAIALQKIADAAGEAGAMGSGTLLSGSVFLAADNTSISFAEGRLQMLFFQAGRNETLSSKIPFSGVDDASGWEGANLSRGAYYFSVNHSGQALSLSLEKS